MNFARKIYNLYLSPNRGFANYIRNLTGATPTDISIFRLAFRHSSASDESDMNNERLEYLGDAVLGMIVANYLFRRFPYKKEGFLTEMRAKIVSRINLNTVAHEMGLDAVTEYQAPSQPGKSSILGNALEALIGAIYIDSGYRAAKRFVINRILRYYVNLERLEATEVNFKSKLLEWGQKTNNAIEFKLLEETVREARPWFRVGILVNGRQVSEAGDYNKKRAEQRASEEAILTVE